MVAPITTCAAITISKGGTNEFHPMAWMTRLTSMGPSRNFAGSRSTMPTIVPTTAATPNQNQVSGGVSKIDTDICVERWIAPPVTNWAMNGSVVTTMRMREAWISAILRGSPPIWSPISTISASPPGMPPQKYAVVMS